MSAPTALGAVSRALQELLFRRLTDTPRVKVTLLRPDEPADPPRINLFLHRVGEQTGMRNVGPGLVPGPVPTLAPAPLSLSLTYLMTAYTTADAEAGEADAHAILGDAMRVFHDAPVIPHDYLGGLVDAPEKLRIRLCPYDVDGLTALWSAFDDSFRLSVQYDVSVVQLEALVPPPRPLAERVRTVVLDSVEAPYVPPRLTGLDRVSGPAGGTVTVHGTGLDRWRATVSVSGRIVVDGRPVVGDVIETPVPSDLVPGFHEVRVDVSELARATFFYEVS